MPSSPCPLALVPCRVMRRCRRLFQHPGQMTSPRFTFTLTIMDNLVSLVHVCLIFQLSLIANTISAHTHSIRIQQNSRKPHYYPPKACLLPPQPGHVHGQEHSESDSGGDGHDHVPPVPGERRRTRDTFTQTQRRKRFKMSRLSM